MHKFTATVEGSRGNAYTVEDTDGVVTCTCPSFRYQSHPNELRACKHMLAVAEQLVSQILNAGQAAAPAPTPQAPLGLRCWERLARPATT